MLAQKKSVTEVAIAVGYDSVSAFLLSGSGDAAMRRRSAFDGLEGENGKTATT